MKTKILALVLGANALWVTPARADGPNPISSAEDDPPPPPPDAEGGFQGGPHDHLFQKLGLSDAQKQQITTIRQQSKTQVKDLGKQLFQAREALSTLMTQHSSQEAATAQFQKVQALGDQLATLRFGIMYQITGVLTPEQRTQLQSLQQEMAKKWHHHGPKHD